VIREPADEGHKREQIGDRVDPHDENQPEYEPVAKSGPVGAVVGGTLGAVAGTFGGILGVEDRPRFRTYVIEQRVPSYRYDSDFRVGATLPDNGVTYYEVPAEYHVNGYRYTYVNDHAVLVDPRTHRIVQIID